MTPQKSQIEADARTAAQLERLNELQHSTEEAFRSAYGRAPWRVRLLARTLGGATAYRLLSRVRTGGWPSADREARAQELDRAYVRAGEAEWRLRVLSVAARLTARPPLSSWYAHVAGRLRDRAARLCRLAELARRPRSAVVPPDSTAEAPAQRVTVDVFAPPLMRPLLRRALYPSSRIQVRSGGSPRDSAAIAQSGADAILVVDGSTIVNRALVERLLDLIAGDPRLGAVGSRGWFLTYEEGAPGFSLDRASSAAPPAVSAGCMLVRAEASRRVGPVDGYESAGWEIELCQRLRGDGWGIAALPDPGHAVAGIPPVELSARDRRLLCERLGPRLRRAAVEASNPSTTSSPLSFVIEVCAPDAASAARGGDFHLAASLARELSRRGHMAAVHTAKERARLEDACFDVRVTLRGREELCPLPGQLNVLWLISHPTDVSARELERHDVVLVASRHYAAELAERVSVPVHAFLQFTDPEVFYPVNGDRTTDTLFVGNWRGAYRQVVWDARAAGEDVSLYGEGWRHLWPEALIREHVPYTELRQLYGSCAVLLNDHWPDMRQHGFISNRLFDALACGAFVVTDRSAAVEEELGGGLVTYEGADELRAVLDRYGGRAQAREAIAIHGRALVLEGHTVKHRVDDLLAMMPRSCAARQ